MLFNNTYYIMIRKKNLQKNENFTQKIKNGQKPEAHR